MSYQSPIAPGRSFYESRLGERPLYPQLDGSLTTDVVIIGGGFTGLQAAFNLARAGVGVVLIEQARFGDGASGRNGGQMGTGQRAWAEDLETQFGFETSRDLFRLAERAKTYLHDFVRDHAIDVDFQPGQMSLVHKPAYVEAYRRHPEIMAQRYGYRHISFMGREETAWRVGSSRYLAGIRDTGTGHIDPLKLVVGLARQASLQGAQLYENTPALSVRSDSGRVRVATGSGTITADHGLIACNGYIGTLERMTAAHVMPIRSFIGATEPLSDKTVIPRGEAIDDSRFVVRYFRKSIDGCLLFGGREAYTADNPRDMSAHIRRQISEIYPALATVRITHAWGGNVAITRPRQPFVREVMPGVISIGGFSGHGVMLSNYCGKLFADMIAGSGDELRLLEAMAPPAFPGGARFRKPLLLLALTWYALLDRL